MINDRQSSTQREYGTRWKTYCARYLAKHSLCVMHMARGQIVPATKVEHTTPHRLRQAKNSGNVEAIEAARLLFLDEKNHVALCDLCQISHELSSSTVAPPVASASVRHLHASDPRRSATQPARPAIPPAPSTPAAFLGR